jgi:hypothetical protein
MNRMKSPEKVRETAISKPKVLKNGFRNVEVEAELREELERLKQKVGMGYEVEVLWLPGTVKHKAGRQLLEEVEDNTIIIYVEDPEEARRLLVHGFFEWILNQYSKPYRQLINSLIELFETQQYERKEKIIDALAKLVESTNSKI